MMNDFTKEELILLKSLSEHRGTMKLINKIQSMLDNHCNHNLAIYIGPNGTKVSCQKCKKEFQ
jgi:hypothetical protein